MTTLLFVLLGINMTALVVVWILYRKAKKAQKKRRIEAPNSEYKSRYVLDLESKDRWENIDLARMHEVNREEVEKVLAKLKATSVRALSTQEKAFLDRMVEAERRAAKAERRDERGRRGKPPTPSPATGAG